VPIVVRTKSNYFKRLFIAQAAASYRQVAKRNFELYVANISESEGVEESHVSHKSKGRKCLFVASRLIGRIAQEKDCFILRKIDVRSWPSANSKTQLVTEKACW